jgi:hypothetical protein
MAIRKKWRRKLTVANRLFIWWVMPIADDSWCGDVLTVSSEVKRFFIRFFLRQPDDRRGLVVIGPEFPGLPASDGRARIVPCEEWQTGRGINPSDVRRLIDWCLDPDRGRRNFRGPAKDGVVNP